MIVDRKEIIILGGPNGAGKTTTARILLPEFFELHPFLNADDIARDLAPWDVESAAMKAGRIYRTNANDGSERYKFCAGIDPVWQVVHSYPQSWLPSPEDSIARVARRVRQGGHDIPDDVIYRRFKTGLWNMRHLYLPLADTAAIYDNSGRQRILIADRESGWPLVVHDQERWSRIEELTQ